jgi:hypothetical protein
MTPPALPSYSTAEKAIDTVVESWKQQMTVAAVLLAFSLTFSKDFLKASDVAARTLVVVAWGALIVSIITGVLAFGRLTFSLAHSRKETALNEAEMISTARTFALLQMVLLFIGVVLLAIVMAIGLVAGD